MTRQPPSPRRRAPTGPQTKAAAPAGGDPGASAGAKVAIAHDDGATATERLTKEARRSGPGFAASLGFHVVIACLFAVIVVAREQPETLPEILGGFLSESDAKKARPPRKPVEIDAFRVADAQSPPQRRPAEKPDEAPDDRSNHIRAPDAVNVTGALAARDPQHRELMPGGTGSEDGGERSVAAGLAWLARVQLPDGRWELHRGYPDAGQIKTDTGATGLALLAMLGAGQTHQQGKFAPQVARAINWLLDTQKKGGDMQGDFYDSAQFGDPASFYAHGQATIAIAEAYALSRDERLRRPLDQALEYLYRSQHPLTGGWKYRPGAEGDLSVTGWQVMALQTARMAGVDVPADVLTRSAGFLDLVQEQRGARYRYEPQATGRSATPAMTAEGLLCRIYLGWRPGHPELTDGIRYLVLPENLPSWSSGRRNVYYWYYATQVLHHLHGAEWKTWNDALRAEITKNQATGAGRTGGSWHPFRPEGAIDENADKGGRLYVTCLCLLNLEAGYRHLPLFGNQQPTEVNRSD